MFLIVYYPFFLWFILLWFVHTIYFFYFIHTSFNITFISSQYYHKTFPFFSKDISSQNLNLCILIPNLNNISYLTYLPTTHQLPRIKQHAIKLTSPIPYPHRWSAQLSNYQKPRPPIPFHPDKDDDPLSHC